MLANSAIYGQYAGMQLAARILLGLFALTTLPFMYMALTAFGKGPQGIEYLLLGLFVLLPAGLVAANYYLLRNEWVRSGMAFSLAFIVVGMFFLSYIFAMLR